MKADYMVMTEEVSGIKGSGDYEIFIPAYSWNKHYYYFDYHEAEGIINKYELDLRNCNKFLKEQLRSKFSYELTEDLLNPFNFAFVPHSSIIQNEKIYVFNVNSYYFLELDKQSRHISVHEEPAGKLISSTNCIKGNYLYYARYSIDDRFVNVMTEDEMYTEVVKYDLIRHKCEVIGHFSSCNICHSLSVSADKRYVIAISTTADPVLEFSKDKKDYEQTELREMLDKGIKKSEIHVLDLKNNRVNSFELHDTPAHIEFDACHPDTCYISSHSLGVNPYNGFVYCVGKAAIHRLVLSEKPELSMIHTADDFSRIPSHKVFQYKGETYIIVTVYPMQIHIINAAKQTLYKRIFMNAVRDSSSLKKGAYKYPRVDRTPFSVFPIDKTSRFYYVNGRNITLMDFESEKIIYQIPYNEGKKPISLLGHSDIG